ncbi:MAG TPA: hypothetical protein VFK86_01940, partial [Bauldia sp.]|nr:hypothetical protein [Bauldia sp.]
PDAAGVPDDCLGETDRAGPTTVGITRTTWTRILRDPISRMFREPFAHRGNSAKRVCERISEQ